MVRVFVRPRYMGTHRISPQKQDSAVSQPAKDFITNKLGRRDAWLTLIFFFETHCSASHQNLHECPQKIRSDLVHFTVGHCKLDRGLQLWPDENIAVSAPGGSRWSRLTVRTEKGICVCQLPPPSNQAAFKSFYKPRLGKKTIELELQTSGKDSPQGPLSLGRRMSYSDKQDANARRNFDKN